MNRYRVPVFCSVLLFIGGVAMEANAQTSAAVAQAHVAAARAVAYQPEHDISETFDSMCREPEPNSVITQLSSAPPPVAAPRSRARSAWYAEPVKVFDNLYYVGSSNQNNQSVWAVTTSEGIILIDSGYDYTVEDLVTNGLKRAGLDPAQIKFVILHHAHGDRYFGAQYLQNTYGARLIMSETDWDVLAKSNQTEDLKPRKDMVATDGMKLTLGDTTLTLYITPGHTPGTLSTLIPLKDGNQQHLGYILGGRGATMEDYGVTYFPDMATTIRTWSASIKRFNDIAAQAGADVFLSIHPQHDKTFNKFTALRFRESGSPHPFVNEEFIQNHTTVMTECMEAQLVWLEGESN